MVSNDITGGTPKVDYVLTKGTTYYVRVTPSDLSSDFPYVRVSVEQDTDGSGWMRMGMSQSINMAMKVN